MKNGGRIGTHIIICWNPSVPQTMSPIHGRWKLTGTGVSDLSLVANSSSVLVPGDKPNDPPHWHGFIRNGEVLTC